MLCLCGDASFDDRIELEFDSPGDTMTRRSLLTWICRAIAGACAAVVIVPGIRYVIHPLRRRGAEAKNDGAGQFQRVARLDDLAEGRPRMASITGVHLDAWTLYPEETIGRVWIVRLPTPKDQPESDDPSKTSIEVFTSVCPHDGCQLGYDPAAERFDCPCHRAYFTSAGEIIGKEELGHKNPSPRPMDALPHQIVKDESSGEWWVEVRYQRFKTGIPEAKVQA